MKEIICSHIKPQNYSLSSSVNDTVGALKAE